MNQVTLNAQDWTGEIITVEYTDNLEFNLVDCEWKLDVQRGERDGSAIVKLIGSDWSEPLTTIFFAGHYPNLPMLDDVWDHAEAIRRAVIYIRNHV